MPTTERAPTVTADSAEQINGRPYLFTGFDDLRKKMAPSRVPGQHLWLMGTVFIMPEPESTKELRRGDLLAVTALRCLWCYKVYRRSDPPGSECAA